MALPPIVELYEAFNRFGLDMAGVHAPTRTTAGMRSVPASRVRRVVDAQRLPFAVALDDTGDDAIAYGFSFEYRAHPRLVLIGADRTVRSLGDGTPEGVVEVRDAIIDALAERVPAAVQPAYRLLVEGSATATVIDALLAVTRSEASDTQELAAAYELLANFERDAGERLAPIEALIATLDDDGESESADSDIDSDAAALARAAVELDEIEANYGGLDSVRARLDAAWSATSDALGAEELARGRELAGILHDASMCATTRANAIQAFVDAQRGGDEAGEAAASPISVLAEAELRRTRTEAETASRRGRD